MPSRSALLPAVAVAAALLLAPRAPADVIVVDAAGHRLGHPGGPTASLYGWTAGGTRLLLGRGSPGGEAVPLWEADPATGARTPLPRRPGLVSIGPSGAWLAEEGDGAGDGPAPPTGVFRLVAPDGRTLSALTLPIDDLFLPGPRNVAWSRDGARVAFAVDGTVVVLDVATGTELRRVPGDRITAQAFSPDGGALLVSRPPAMVRVDVGTGAEEPAAPADPAAGSGLWSDTGRIAIVSDESLHGSVTFPAAPGARLALPQDVQDVGWAPGGTALAVVSSARCTRTSLRLVAAPGSAAPPVLLARGAFIMATAWSPDGARLAVQVQGEPRAPGPRPPWPRQAVPMSFHMSSARGDRLVRRLVVRFTADLRGGMDRRHAVDRLGAGMRRLARTPSGLAMFDQEPVEIVTRVANRWLRAAAMAPLDGLDADRELRSRAC